MEILIIEKDFGRVKKLHTNLTNELDYPIPFVGEGATIQIPINSFMERITWMGVTPNPLKYGLGDKLNKSVRWWIKNKDNSINMELSRNNEILGIKKYPLTIPSKYFVIFENIIIPSDELGSVWITQHTHSHERNFYNFLNIMAHFDIEPYKIGE
jgi:hypothetical protein